MVRHLNAAQRHFLLSVTRAYRTSPTSALQVIAGLPPLNLVARHLHATWLRGLNQEFDLIENQTELHCRGRVRIREEADNSDIQLFTDGSKTKTGVGLSVVGYKDGRVFTSIQERLVFTSTVFQAELRAILLTTRLVLNNGWTERVTIFSDSRAALDSIVKFEVVNRTALETYLNITRAGNIDLTWVKAHAGTEGNEEADRLAKEATELEDPTVDVPLSRANFTRDRNTAVINDWQRLWDNRTDGRSTYDVIEHVDFEGFNLSSKAVQALTGHGSFNSYFNRFRLRETDGLCICGSEQDTPRHVLWQCEYPRRLAARAHFEMFMIRKGKDPHTLSLTNKSPPDVIDRLNKMCKDLVFEYDEEV